MTVSKVALVVSLAAAVVAGCGPEGPTKQDTGLAIGAITGGVIGSQFGRGAGRAVGTAAGIIIGGIVGSEIGRAMDRQDRLLAQEAEYEAFERGPSGAPRRWRNAENGHYGEIVPRAPYRRGEVYCRDYEHTVFIGGRREIVRGTACRNPDGSWRNMG